MRESLEANKQEHFLYVLFDLIKPVRNAILRAHSISVVIHTGR